MLVHNAEVTGSLKINNVLFNSGSFSGSFRGDGSQLTGVTGATTASYVEYSNVGNKPALVSGSSQITYSGLSGIPSGIVSGSSQVTYSGLTGIPAGIVSSSAQVTGFGIFATTGSNSFNGSQVVTGSLTVTGQVVAQTLNVQQVTSSIVFSSGSNIFGNSLSNTQQFTGSVSVTGSLTVNGVMSLNNDGTYGSAYKTLGFTGNINGSHRIFAGTSDDMFFAAATGRGLDFRVSGSANSSLYIAATSAAIFSGPTVTIGTAVATTNVKLIFNGVASKAAGIEFHQSGTPQWYIGNGIASEDNNFELYNSNGTMAMKIIKSTNAINFIGAATFSSSVTSVGLISSSTVRPSSNYAADLGTSSVRWADIFGASLNVATTSTAANVISIINATQRLDLGVNDSAGGSFIFASANKDLRFGANDAEKMRLTSDGYLRMASGTGGIQFNGDTAAANALDDYEEGTWTPTIEGEGSNPTLTGYSTQVGRYTKIGRVVTIHCALQPAGTSVAGTGNLRFGGLPFTSANIVDVIGNGVANSNGNFSWGSGKTQLVFSVGVNTTKISVWAMQNGTTEAGIPVNNFNNSSQYLLFSLTYIAT